MKGPFIRSCYNYDAREVSDATSYDSTGQVSLTVQSFAGECDINNIVKRYAQTGVLPQNLRVPMYGDFTEVRDYASALQAIRDAEESFDALDPEVRARFENDPQLFLEFCDKEENWQQLKDWGFCVKGPPGPITTPQTGDLLNPVVSGPPSVAPPVKPPEAV